MNIKNLFADEDAVSPVIGVILMVAITVILAAVIGAFVLGIGGSQEAAPQASLAADYEPSSSGAAGFETSSATQDGDTVKISHEGGGTFDATQLSITISGETVDDPTDASAGASNPKPSATDWSTGTSAGDVVTFTESSLDTTVQSGDSVTVTWTASSGDSSQIIFESQVP